MEAALDTWLPRLAVMAASTWEFILQVFLKETWLLNQRTKRLARRQFRWAEKTRKHLRRTSVLRVLLVLRVGGPRRQPILHGGKKLYEEERRRRNFAPLASLLWLWDPEEQGFVFFLAAQR